MKSANHNFDKYAELQLQGRPYEDSLLPGNINKVLKAIDRKQLRSIQKELMAAKDGLIEYKYLDYKKFVGRYVRRAHILGLHERNQSSILDLGTGAGYFPFACNWLGHVAEAVDVGNSPVYNRTIPALGVKRHSAYIEPFKSLPIKDGKYDIITAFAISFDLYFDSEELVSRMDPKGIWGAEEWNFFLTDILDNRLNKGGVIWLYLNERNGVRYTPELEVLFRKHGGRICGPDVFFDTSLDHQ